MSSRCGELVTANEPTAVSEPLRDAIMVEDSKSNGCFSDPPWTNESDRSEVFSESDDLFD